MYILLHVNIHIIQDGELKFSEHILTGAMYL